MTSPNSTTQAGAAVAPADILATAVTPWTADYRFDEKTFRRHVRAIAEGLTRHIYLFGTAGEGYALTDSQFDQVTAAFWDESQQCGVVPMVGLISLSLPVMVERIERARARGFRRFQISLPSWGPLNDQELDRFFADTCGRFTDCEFNHYNLMRTKRLLTSVEYRRLAAAHPNLKSVKASTKDPAVIADLLTVSPRLRFYITEAGYAIARQSTREVGLLISLATVNYRRAREFVAGDDARRAADVADLMAMAAVLIGRGKDRFHMDGAYDKMLARVGDPGMPLRLLPPYASATEEDFAAFQAAIPAAWRV